jgi:hypothetical protein
MTNGHQNGLNSYRYLSGPKANARQMYGLFRDGGTQPLQLYSQLLRRLLESPSQAPPGSGFVVVPPDGPA